MISSRKQISNAAAESHMQRLHRINRSRNQHTIESNTQPIEKYFKNSARISSPGADNVVLVNVKNSKKSFNKSSCSLRGSSDATTRTSSPNYGTEITKSSIRTKLNSDYDEESGNIKHYTSRVPDNSTHLVTKSASPALRMREYASTRNSRDSASDLSSKTKSIVTKRGIVGLQNLGNTCFMNCSLQCLNNIPKLVNYFVEKKHTSEISKDSTTKGDLALSFGKLVSELTLGAPNSSVRPIELKRVIGIFASRFLGYEQQDAQEFLRFLLDGLHEDLNRIRNKPPYYEIKEKSNATDRDISNEYWKYYNDRNSSQLSDLFCGQLRSEVICDVCKNHSICFDTFWDLSIPIPKQKKSKFGMFSRDSEQCDSSGISIEECLKAYTEKEHLKEVDAYYCSKCKTHRSVSKQISIYRCPEILVLHLKRFSFSTYSRDKVSTSIRVNPEGLEIGAFCHKDAFLDIQDSMVYRLIGMVHHMGSLNGGHYTAECLNESTNQWYEYNDANVSLVRNPSFSSSSAYILFLQRTKN